MMSLRGLFMVLKARYGIVLATIATALAIAVVTSLLLPKTYTANTSLVLNYTGANQVTGMTMSGQLLPAYLATQVDIIKSPRVAMQVIESLKLADDPLFRRAYDELKEPKEGITDWLSQRLLKKLQAIPARDSSVVEIRFSAQNPQLAARVANGFASAYQQISMQLKAEPARIAADYFDSQILELRERVENARNALSAYQKEYGIINGESQFDLETGRLNDMATQLVIAQAQAAEATFRGRQARGNGSTSPDVQSNSLIQNLRASLAVAEAKFADISHKLERNHPQYQAASSEVESLRENLNAQIKIASQGVSGNARILEQREAELRSALAAQKARVLQLNRDRDKLKMLNAEIETAQRGYELATQRRTQTGFEARASQTDVVILSPAVPPALHSSPMLLLNIAAASVLGVVMGTGLALLLETCDRRFRSARDVADLMDAPLLGVVQWRQGA